VSSAVSTGGVCLSMPTVCVSTPTLPGASISRALSERNWNRRATVSPLHHAADDMSQIKDKTEGNRPAIEVVKPGWLTTVQDLGRHGYQRYGMPVSGAMDRFAAIVGNRLVGNPDGTAVLECTLKGPELLFRQDTYLALTGADLSPTLDGSDIPGWECIAVRGGSRLRFGRRRAGFRCYVAIAGGFDVPVVLGSRSTHCPSQTGGLNGRPLQRGDLLFSGPRGGDAGRLVGRRLPARLLPQYDRSVLLRVILDPRREFFQEAAAATLTNSVYTIAPQSDRMGYRLRGPTIPRRDTTRFISEGTVTGALQVPADGQPILLMADRQTTGGYPSLAVVISADLPLAGQLGPGDSIRFAPCSLIEAQALLRTQWHLLEAALPT
ncbi:MAG: biotin-dependent carboxyltransferase family protein, partial [Nitrospira sp.]|nr:biotin-dependent carboxyltransferase family protein [Nitrospira sp.]